jgi:hypothetical protein
VVVLGATTDTTTTPATATDADATTATTTTTTTGSGVDGRHRCSAATARLLAGCALRHDEVRLAQVGVALVGTMLCLEQENRWSTAVDVVRMGQWAEAGGGGSSSASTWLW